MRSGEPSCQEDHLKFPDLLISAIKRSEIPLRFEPGAEEAVAKPVTEVLRAWSVKSCANTNTLPGQWVQAFTSDYS